MAPRSLYIPHGGGPMPLLDDPGHAELITYLKGIEAEIGRPSAIVVVSAHWEEPTPTITANPNPELYFDYYGFPPETYEYTYAAPGSVELAERLASAIADAGVEPRLDAERGYDHGMFVPLMLMYPDASIPVVQVSLIDGLDPAAHIELGKSLRPALDDDMLVLGSGLSFHNMGAFNSGEYDGNQPFDEWLEAACTGEMTEDARRSELIGWEAAPAARYNHPREEHLLPLHVCYGVGGGAATRTFDGLTLGSRVAAYAWV